MKRISMSILTAVLLLNLCNPAKAGDPAELPPEVASRLLLTIRTKENINNPKEPVPGVSQIINHQ